jgi:hypothetical protein
MRNILTITAIVGLCFMVSANADTYQYGWEDGGTVLGMSPAASIVATNVTTTVHGGEHSLQLVRTSTATPQAYVAWIRGLQDGDVIDASFWRYDVTPAVSPSCRIWGHWNDNPNDVMGTNGSAGGTDDYGPGTGWDMTTKTWTVTGGHTGLIIEVRVYGTEVGANTVWVDDLTVTVPSHATVTTPTPEPATLSLLGLGFAALLRRR